MTLLSDRRSYEDVKAEFLCRERQIIDRCQKEVAAAQGALTKAKEMRERCQQMLDHMDYDGLRRVLSIREDKLAVLGIRVISGKVEL